MCFLILVLEHINTSKSNMNVSLTVSMLFFPFFFSPYSSFHNWCWSHIDGETKHMFMAWEPFCMQNTCRLGSPISFTKCGKEPWCDAGQVSVCVLKCLAFKATIVDFFFLSEKETWISYSKESIGNCTYAQYQFLTNWLGLQFCKETTDFTISFERTTCCGNFGSWIGACHGCIWE